MAYQYPCTECNGDATIAYIPDRIKQGKRKGEEKPGWDGLVLPGERLCSRCFKKRGGRLIFG